MATLHVRNVPPELYDALRARAVREGRSINAETIVILREMLSRPVPFDPESFLAEIRAAKERWSWPAEGPTPEEIIRRDRDSH